MREFDLIVIGSGSGLDVAVAAANSGLQVAVVERGPLGGTCLNRGCIPSKMLIHSADVVETIKDADNFGIKVTGYEVDFPSIVRQVTETVDRESGDIERSFRGSANPILFKGECHFVAEKTLQVGTETLKAGKLLIATGSRARIPEVSGLREAGFITSDEALRLTEQPKVLTILGGGYIAAELAHFFGTLGTQINIVQRGKYLVPNEDEEVAAIYTHLTSEKYNVLLGYEPILVAKNGGLYNVTLQNNENRDETRIVTSNQLLVAVGRTPNSDTLDLEKTGVKTDPKGYILADNYLETAVKGIFALGDALGRYPFKHTANHEAAVAYKNIMDPENKVEVDYAAIPHAIFTSPQIAGVGKTEQQLKAENVGYFIGRWNYADTAMGEAIQDATGFVKFLIDRATLKILGCHIMGTGASILIHEVLVAMKSGDGTINSVSKVVHIHPALPEVVRRAAEYIIDPTHHHEHTDQ